MKETVVTFGPGGILVGVLCEPDGLRRGAPIVVMSNVGLNHRVGPSRMWVELARRLALLGVASLRFDVSGLGDSAPRGDLLNDIDRSVLDLQDALEWLATRVGSRFVLAALCSGTDNAHRVAVEDPRVVGAIFLDGYTYPTARLLVHRYVLRWVSPRHWNRGFRRRFPRAFGIDPEATLPREPIYNREYPSREQFEADLERIAAHAKLLFIFSGETMYLYEGQFWDWLNRKDWGGRISVEHYPKANHTYSFFAERQVMLDRVERWILSLQASLSAPPPRLVEEPRESGELPSKDLEAAVVPRQARTADS
jgi:hypothetical protein